jgi:transposase
MVWGSIGGGYRSPLVFIRGRLNAHRYIDGHAGVIFQHDNARRPHIPQITRTFLQQAEIEILHWPARSSDLNPIEHVWDTMGRRLRRTASL